MTSKGQKLRLRCASHEDEHLLFEWRNDLTTRSMFFSSKPVSREGHAEWLEMVLSDPDERLIVGELGGRPAGVVRLTGTSDGVLISITVNPQSRGQGVGSKLLRKCLVENADGWSPGVPFVARIKIGNVASLKIFRACRFVQVGSHGNAVVMHRAR